MLAARSPGRGGRIEQRQRQENKNECPSIKQRKSKEIGNESISISKSIHQSIGADQNLASRIEKVGRFPVAMETDRSVGGNEYETGGFGNGTKSKE